MNWVAALWRIFSGPLELRLPLFLFCALPTLLPAQSIREPSPIESLKHENADSVTTGAVTGIIRFQGEIPKSTVPDDTGRRRPLLRVDRATRGLGEVVAWLEAKTGEKSHGVDKPEPEQRPPALMDQRGHEFHPRVLAVRSGEPVEFTNSDPANHNVRTSSPQGTNEFNVFTGVDGSYTHRFLAGARGRPVRVGCDIHPWMRGWIYVFDHRWFAVTDEQGEFRIDGVSPGDYTLMVRQPDIRYRHDRQITVTGGAPTRVEIEVKADEESEAASDSIQ